MSDFKGAVYDLVGRIPRGRVMSYGQIAALCGHPRAARQVGQLAHFGPAELPWQRVVRQDGGLAGGFPGGMAGHQALLEDDGITVRGFKVEIDKLIWWP